MSNFEFRPATAGTWSELADFFRANSNSNYCWCMRWRLHSKEFAKNGRKIVRFNTDDK